MLLLAGLPLRVTFKTYADPSYGTGSCAMVVGFVRGAEVGINAKMNNRPGEPQFWGTGAFADCFCPERPLGKPLGDDRLSSSASRSPVLSAPAGGTIEFKLKGDGTLSVVHRGAFLIRRTYPKPIPPGEGPLRLVVCLALVGVFVQLL